MRESFREMLLKKCPEKIWAFRTIFWLLTLKYKNGMPKAIAAISRPWGDSTYPLRITGKRDGKNFCSL